MSSFTLAKHFERILRMKQRFRLKTDSIQRDFSILNQYIINTKAGFQSNDEEAKRLCELYGFGFEQLLKGQPD